MLNVLVPMAFVGAAVWLLQGDQKPAKAKSTRSPARRKGRARLEKVVQVIDGDTIRVHGREERVRIRDVNAPELGEPGAAAAKKVLERTVLNKNVELKIVARDRYRRAVAEIFVGGKPLSGVLRKKVGTKRRK